MIVIVERQIQNIIKYHACEVDYNTGLNIGVQQSQTFEKIN